MNTNMEGTVCVRTYVSIPAVLDVFSYCKGIDRRFSFESKSFASI